MKRLPLFVTCQRPGCGGIRSVRHPREQRRGKYCSRFCAAMMNQNLMKRPETRRNGLLAGIQSKKRKMREKVQGLTPLEAFQLGYETGMRSKVRYLKRLVREIRAAKGRAA